MLNLLFNGLLPNISPEIFCSHFFSEKLFCANLEIIVLQNCVALLEHCFFLVVCKPTHLCIRIRKSFAEVFPSLVYIGYICLSAFFFWTVNSKQQSFWVFSLSYFQFNLLLYPIKCLLLVPSTLQELGLLKLPNSRKILRTFQLHLSGVLLQIKK